MQSYERPKSLAVVCWLVLAWSGLGAATSALRLTRIVEVSTIYVLVLSLAKIACAAAMLRRVPHSRTLFLALYLAAATVVGPIFQWPMVADGTLVFPYVVGFFIFFVWFLLLTQPHVARWFGAREPVDHVFDWLTSLRPLIGRLLARAWLAASVLIVLGFVARAVLDLYAAAVYRPAPATIVAADVRDADVRTGRQRDASTGETRSTTTIVTYDPKITFRYVVAGRTYERTGFTTFGSTLSATFSPASVRDRYAVGTQQTAWYDPSDPSRAVLEFGVSPYYAFAFFALLMLVMARAVAR